LYEAIWCDISNEPVVMQLPALAKRYALFPMLDAWTNVFASPGTRTTGDDAQTFAVTGPGWRGTLPAGVGEYKCPTSFFWMIGRIYSSGTPDDFAAVHQLQDAMKVVPLSAYGTMYKPPAGRVDPSIDMKTAVVTQVNALPGAVFFTTFAQLLAKNPPPAADAPMVAKLAQLGIVPGQGLDPGKLDPAILAAMNAAPAAALPQIKAYLPRIGKAVNGWTYSTRLGSYGTEYALRAVTAWMALGANLAADAVYPTTIEPLDGSKSYTLHFDKGMLPPAKAFWSITLYNAKQYFYDNPLNRYCVGSRSNFVYSADGSLDIYVAHESPGKEKEGNWLPAPADRFSLMMRLYLPTATPPSILDGSWSPPAPRATVPTVAGESGAPGVRERATGAP
jgi:hypothetical protein